VSALNDSVNNLAALLKSNCVPGPYLKSSSHFSNLFPMSNVFPGSNVVPVSNVVPGSNVVPVSNVVPSSNVVPVSNVVPSSNVVSSSNVVPSSNVVSSSNVASSSNMDSVGPFELMVSSLSPCLRNEIPFHYLLSKIYFSNS
jgi:hypothetical protein